MPKPMTWQHRLIDTLVPHLDPALLTREYRSQWSAENPTAGFCSIAAEVAYFVLGGVKQGWVAMVAQDPEGGTHWWLERNTPQGRERFDPTADQYLSQGQTPPYERGRPGGFMGQRQDPGNPFGFDRRPGVRAHQVLASLMNQSNPGASLALADIQTLRVQVGLETTGATPTAVTPEPRRRHRLR
jgi:hypothetical protein